MLAGWRSLRWVNVFNYVMMRRLTITGLLVIVALVSITMSACGGATSATPHMTVRIVGNPLGNPDSLYKPDSITIRPGTTVTWVDHDDSDHTVTPDGSYQGWSGGSGDLATGDTYGYQFKRLGHYTYHCMVHPGMVGVVNVVRKQS